MTVEVKNELLSVEAVIGELVVEALKASEVVVVGLIELLGVVITIGELVVGLVKLGPTS